jgi:hypothetical protein
MCRMFDRANTDDAREMAELLRSGDVRCIHDEIDQQLNDLARSRDRRQLADADGRAILGKLDRDVFGRWVHYPWLNTLVHVLPHEQFRELRLDRNRHKITTLELDSLAASTIAIVGLSAGNAIARCLCLEGISESFKLADFDTLTLSNMNRLEAGLHDIGLRKTILVARQLLEINPYVELTLWHDGITAAGLDAFLLDAPRPSVLIDECDDMPMKVLLRERARALGVPVLMETSDRGMLDVERFDLEPARPLLHGLIGDVSSGTIRDLREDDRLALVLAIVGAESISTRAAASLLEIKQTLSTWPQLASDVILGGAVMTVAVRRLLLGQPLASGRRYIDVDSVLAAPPTPDCTQQASRSPAVCGEAAPDVSHPAAARVSELARFVVAHGVLAPSGGNCQPWQFHAEASHLWIVHDRVRAANLLNSDSKGSQLALGAAIENIELAAKHRGHRVTIDWFPRGPTSDVVARLSFSFDATPAGTGADDRFAAIPRRVTNRQRGTATPLDPAHLAALTKSTMGLGVHAQLLVDGAALARVGTIAGECDRIRLLCPPLHAEMMREVRWTVAEAERTRNGLALDTLGLTAAQSSIFRLLARPDVAAVLRDLDAGRGLIELSRAGVAASSAIGLIATDRLAPVDVLRAGRAFQRVWLDATIRGISLQPLGAVTALFGMLRTEASAVLGRSEQTRLKDLEDELYANFPAVPPRCGLMLFRLSDAPPPPARSLRLPPDVVLYAGAPSEVVA